jgi:hypothetical protein
MTHGRLDVEYKFVSAVIDALAGNWPVLNAVCFENEVRPHYWP